MSKWMLLNPDSPSCRKSFFRMSAALHVPLLQIWTGFSWNMGEGSGIPSYGGGERQVFQIPECLRKAASSLPLRSISDCECEREEPLCTGIQETENLSIPPPPISKNATGGGHNWDLITFAWIWWAVNVMQSNPIPINVQAFKPHYIQCFHIIANRVSTYGKPQFPQLLPNCGNMGIMVNSTKELQGLMKILTLILTWS